MDPERWKRIEEAFNAALELPEGERGEFLDDSFSDDTALREEVERLLRVAEREPESLASLIGEAAAAYVEPAAGPDLSGTTIGHYEVQRRIGAGGMGAVYLALDRRLGRKVALKVLPESLRRDRDLMRRFEHEARTLSALNHPHIITLHDIEMNDDVLAIVTEYVEGETLAQRLSRGSLTYSEVADIGAQVAEALAEAHHNGIVHRDIKPGNIMLTPRGVVKVLDFGLAKMLGAGPAALFEAATETIRGMVLGTVRYMSPEQARGQAADRRSDIFSLGSVLFEMTTGTPAFGKAAAVETLQRIVSGQHATLDILRRDVPAELARIVNKCLETDPAWRYQDAGDVAVDLRALRRDIDSGAVRALGDAVTPSARMRRWPVMAAGVIVLLAAFGLMAWRGWLPWTGSGVDASAAASFHRLTNEPGEELFPTVSPDGQSIIYAAHGDLYLQRADGRNAINLTPDSPAIDTQPAYAPDGGRVAFRSERGGGGGIYIMGATGESVRRISDFGFNPAWSPDGRFLAVVGEGVKDVYSRNSLASELWLIDVESGARRQLEVPDAVQPAWSPSGERIAFWSLTSGNRDLWTVPIAGGTPRQVTDDTFEDWNPVWSPDGSRLLFASNRGGAPNLWQVSVNERNGAVRGTPKPLITPSSSVQHFARSADGQVIAYVDRDVTVNLNAFDIDPESGSVDNRARALTAGSFQIHIPSISPDGQWLAFTGVSGSHLDLFVVRSDGSGLRQLTDDPVSEFYPNWSIDGRRLIFYSDRRGTHEAWTIAVDGSDMHPENVPGATVVYPRWSPDGTWLSFSLFGGNTYVMPVDQPADARPLPITEPAGSWFIGWGWSPDSQRLAGWMGYKDAEHGGIVIYSMADGSYMSVTEAGMYPVWLRDGRRLLYQADGKLYLADLDSNASRLILDVAPDKLEGCVLAPDDRTVYCSRRQSESDIWVMRHE